MKSYSDLEQSKKLAEILPLESADMYYQYVLPKSDKIRYNPILGNPIEALEWYNKGYTHFGKEPLSLKEYCIPCWSLAALVNILRKDFEVCIIGYEKAWKCHVTNRKTLVTDWLLADNPIDCCYGMILKLHELNLL